MVKEYKLWVGRSPQTNEEFDRDIPGKLHIFYDGPPKYSTIEHDWVGARCIGEIPSYMFPEIKEGMCIQFTYSKNLRKHIN